MSTEEERRYSHPGITRIREQVDRSYEAGICEWCKMRISKRDMMHDHLREHVVMQKNVLIIQALRQGNLDARDID